MMKRIAITLGTAGAACALASATPSALWGDNGEAWDPAGRLPDVSYAGYACGEKPLPKYEITANVRKFGAKGDGIADDTAAFLEAIRATERGAILVPAGRYRITSILEITKPGLVLRGEGPERSILVCPKPLNDIKPNWGEATSGKRTSNYSWSGGIVWFKGGDRGAKIGAPTAPAKRGDREIRIAHGGKAATGNWIEIKVRDDESKSLLEHLYSGDPGNVGKIKPASHKTSFVTRVRSTADNLLRLDRPLRIDIRPEWMPEVRLYQPQVTGSGIEQIGFEFPVREYGGHFSELGFNAVAFNGVAHCWARDLVITNSDSGVFAGGRFCTIDGLVCRMRGVKENKGVFGHHGVTLSGHDNILTHFRIEQRYIHDISVEGGAGNVSSCGCGTDLCFDHHKRAPYENVFTDIDAGKGTRLWHCGGGADLGRQCGARGTFWNIRTEQPQHHPGGFGPASMNLVALTTKDKPSTDPKGRWFEAIPPDRISPKNLHEAQLLRRLGAK